MRDLSRYCAIKFTEKGEGWHGCDCWGLVRLFYQEELGIELDDFRNLYSGVRDMASILAIAEEQRKKWRKVFGERQVGDVVEIPLGKRNYHVGVIAAPGWVLHIEEGGFGQAVPITSQRIARRIEATWRHATFES